MSHTLMSLDAEWRRLARTGRARQALKQWSIAHPTLRGLADLDGLLERRRDDQSGPRHPPGPGRARRRRRSGRPDPAPGAAARPGPPGRIAGYDDPPRSRRWCRWAGNASAPTRPGAGVRWRPTCCSKCASATTPIVESTHPDRLTPRGRCGRRPVAGRCDRRPWPARRPSDRSLPAGAVLAVEAEAVVALGLPGRQVAGAVPVRREPGRESLRSRPRRERSVEALLTWRGLRPAIRRPRGDGSAGRPQATMGMACMAANRACPWACASPPASTSVRACW